MAVIPGGLLLGCLYIVIGFLSKRNEKRIDKKDKDHARD